MALLNMVLQLVPLFLDTLYLVFDWILQPAIVPVFAIGIAVSVIGWGFGTIRSVLWGA